MARRYLSLDLPEPVVSLGIQEDIKAQEKQSEYFRLRTKLGPELYPTIYEPVIESEDSLLLAMFVAPGEIHLVFKDEIAPIKKWDEWYRDYRLNKMGRIADIESIEVTEEQFVFHWCFCFANLYEFGYHFTGRQDLTNSIYSSTWNHMLSTNTSFPIRLRGGYQEMSPEIYNGDRNDAEEYARSL